jgi:hypothetical protein
MMTLKPIFRQSSFYYVQWQANLLLSSGEEVLRGSEVEVIQLDVYFTLVAWRR